MQNQLEKNRKINQSSEYKGASRDKGSGMTLQEHSPDHTPEIGACKKTSRILYGDLHLVNCSTKVGTRGTVTWISLFPSYMF